MPNALKLTTPTDREIVVVREFDAPRELVWDSIFKPELLRRWMYRPARLGDDHLRGRRLHRRDVSPRLERPEWHDHVTVRRPPGSRPARAHASEPRCSNPVASPKGGEQLGTIVLTELGERTMLTMTFLFDSKEARDGTVASGMEQGMAAGFDRLDEILASAAA